MTQTSAGLQPSLLTRAISRISRWWNAPRGLSTTDAGFADMAHDVGLSSDQLAQLITKGHTNRALMPAMVAQNGIDLAAVERLEPALVRDMERVCSLCTDLRACKRDLAKGEGAEHYHDYCLNAATIDAIKADGTMVRSGAVTAAPAPKAATSAAPAATTQVAPACCC